MQCEQARELIGAYRDGELPPQERRVLEAHIAGCSRCREMLDDDVRLGRTIRQAGRIAAPSQLTMRVMEQLDRIDLEPVAAGAMTAKPRPRFGSQRLREIGRRAALLIFACCVSALAAWWQVSSLDQRHRVEREVVSAHVRSLLFETPVQIASSDQHAVRPWFAGRTEFAPNVKDLSEYGFTMAGGRLDYVDDRRVGAIVYKRRLHIINLLMWPSPTSADAPPKATKRNGFNIVHSIHAGMAYWIVSDLNADELLELARRL